jgi:hypothetical protein
MSAKLRSRLNAFDRALANESWQTYRRIIYKLCQDYPDCSWATSIPGLLRNKDISGLVSLADSLVATKYATATSHFVANQMSALIRKYPFPKHLNPYDSEAKAKETWIEMEQKCSYLNSKFLSPLRRELSEKYDRMRKFISYALSDYVPLKEIYDNCDIGPGASVGVHGKATNLARKFGGIWSVSPAARDYARSAILQNWHLVELLNHRTGPVVCLDVDELTKSFNARTSAVSYNKVTFVPKTVRTLRSIAVEPLLNTFLQKGVDNVLRLRLLRVGIDLRHQSINSEMARKGSMSDELNSFVTLDLSNASDSISTGLCKELLPPDWFYFLNQIRSHEYLLDGEVYPYHKFCSMGNGFCFPLETLIFTAACFAVGAGTAPVDFHVYGDDIILQKRYAEPVIELLNDMGFEINLQKSFVSGFFKESCGSDWYCGDDVRPITLDFELNSLESIFKILNLSRRSWRTFAFFEGIRDDLISLIPSELRFFRPVAGPENVALTVENDLFMTCPYAEWSKDLQCWSWIELVMTPMPDKGWESLEKSNLLLLMAALRGANPKVPFAIRRKTYRAIRRVAYSPVRLTDWEVVARASNVLLRRALALVKG